jgi:GT2 family glycosyltransferase
MSKISSFFSEAFQVDQDRDSTRLISAVTPKVAVMVINYNGRHHLKSCLESLRDLTYPNYDVYIIDNCSKDGSLEYIAGDFPWVKLINFEKNLGFAAAYNRSIALLQDVNLVAILNNDTRVTKEWLSALVNEIVKDQKIIAVGSKIRLYFSPELLHNAGSKISPVNGGFDIGLFEQDDGSFDLTRYVGALCGASMLVRKDLFMRIGGFDEDYFAFYEDVDFCWRAWLYGYNVVYTPFSVVYHKRGGSFGQNSALGTFLGGRNQLLTIIKNCQLPNLIIGLFFITPVIVTRAFLRLKDRKIDEVFSTCNAVIWILRNLRKVLCKRQVIQKNRVIFDGKLLSIGVMASTSESIRECLKLI